MPYKFFKHTADVRLKVEAETIEKLFTDAFQGMMEFIKPENFSEAEELNTREIKLDSYDQTTLLIDFLNEVLYNSHTFKELYTSIKIIRLTDNHIEAVIRGNPIEEFSEDIKAVTYHEAEVRKTSDGKWETTIILDI